MDNISSFFINKILKYKPYFSGLLVLAFPLLIGTLGHTVIGATDILVVARYSIDDLAAVSIANSILYTVFILGLGIVIAVSIILSNLRGKGDKTKKYLFSTIIFSLVLAFIFTFVCYATKYAIPFFGFEDKLVPIIQQYIEIVSFSMFGVFLFEGIKQYLQSFEIVKLPNIVLLFAVFFNLLFDIVFVLGAFGMPAMGAKGAAIATLSVRSLMGIVMLLYIFKFIDFKSKIDFSYMKKLVKTGFPIGMALLFEYLAFNIITILVGRESGVLSATHNILITISSTTFAIPLSIAIALSVKVAYFYGAKQKEEIKKYSYAALMLGVGVMSIASIILFVFPKQVIGLFTKDAELLQIALPLVSIVAMYQVFDGFQVVVGGILKGFKLTKFVSDSVFWSYWFAGMPVAVYLVWKLNMSLFGYWIALAVALYVMGLSQTIMALKKFKEIQ